MASFDWADLTVPNASEIVNFYKDILGYNVDKVSMGDYDDYCLIDSSNVPVAGVCHGKGVNKDIPPFWIIYFKIDDLDKSLNSLLEKGGTKITEPKNMGDDIKYCIVKDPNGTPFALFEKKE